MATFTELLPATKTVKHAGINWTPGAAGSGRLTINQGRKSSEYHVQPLATTWGRGWTLSKLDGSERYCVLIGKPGEASRCDCPAGCYRESSRVPCKHIAACLALIENEFLWSDRSEPKAATEEPVADPRAAFLAKHVAPSPRDTADQGAF